MTRIRIGESVFLIPDEQWEDWVRRGRIPPEAWIFSPYWTRGTWRLAESLEVYHLFLPARSLRSDRPAPGLTQTIFAKRGLSMTEALTLINLLVTAVLFLVWRNDYDPQLWWLSRLLRNFVGDGRGFPAVLIPMFLHATPSHLFFNMIALLASGSVIEYFYGRWKMLASYIMAGYGGAALSLALREKTVLSVGASGAIFGLYGLALLFLLRHYRRFGARQRWKTVRIYLPILVLAVIPAIFGGDFYTHLGGFLSGCAIGVFLPPGPRIAYLTPGGEMDTPDPASIAQS